MCPMQVIGTINDRMVRLQWALIIGIITLFLILWLLHVVHCHVVAVNKMMCDIAIEVGEEMFDCDRY